MSLIHFDILESTQFKGRPTCFGFRFTPCAVSGESSDSGIPFGAPLSKLLFFFFLLPLVVENDLGVLRQSLTVVFRMGFWGPPLLEVRYSLAHNEYVRSPIFIPSSVLIPVAHAYINHAAHTYTHRRTAQWQGPPAAPKHGIPHLFVYASFSFPELY